MCLVPVAVQASSKVCVKKSIKIVDWRDNWWIRWTGANIQAFEIHNHNGKNKNTKMA